MTDFKIDTADITTFVDDTENAVADVNSTFTEIVTQYNAAFNATTGHVHDGTDSPSISAGIGSLSSLEIIVGQIMGGFE